jgi:hypothetical protein
MPGGARLLLFLWAYVEPSSLGSWVLGRRAASSLSYGASSVVCLVELDTFGCGRNAWAVQSVGDGSVGSLSGAE